MDRGELAREGERLHLLPFGGSEGGLGFGGEEPFVKKELEAEAGGDQVGTCGEFAEVEEGELEELVRFFVGQLGAEQVSDDAAGGEERIVIFADVEKRIEKGGILKGKELFFCFAIDPLGKAKGFEFRFVRKEREKPFRCKNLEDFFMAEIGDRLQEKAWRCDRHNG